MKEAIITATFRMPSAWDDTDTADTGLQPLEGIREFLEGEGLIDDFIEGIYQFGLELLEYQVTEVRDELPEIS